MRKEEVADLIDAQVRYVEDSFWSLTDDWTEIFFRNSFNINNHLMFSHVYLGSILNSQNFE